MGSTQQPDKPVACSGNKRLILRLARQRNCTFELHHEKNLLRAKGSLMKLSLDTSRPAIVPLRDAMLCIDCEFVTPAANGNCSICSGHRLVILSELLELLVEQACGTKAPARLADLASILVGNNSLRRSSSHNQHQKEPFGFQPLRYFEC